MALRKPSRTGWMRAASLALPTRRRGSAGSGGRALSVTGFNWPGSGNGSGIVTISTVRAGSAAGVATIAGGGSSKAITGGLADVVAQPASADAETNSAAAAADGYSGHCDSSFDQLRALTKTPSGFLRRASGVRGGCTTTVRIADQRSVAARLPS